MVSFEAEQKLVRLRPRAGRLILPTFVLGAVVAALAFCENLKLESWQSIAINIVAAIVILFGWITPVVRHLVRWVEITTAWLVWRDGLFGQKRVEVSWQEVEAVEYSRGRITVFIGSQEPLVLIGLPKAKQLAREMQNLVRG